MSIYYDKLGIYIPLSSEVVVKISLIANNFINLYYKYQNKNNGNCFVNIKIFQYVPYYEKNYISMIFIKYVHSVDLNYLLGDPC